MGKLYSPQPYSLLAVVVTALALVLSSGNTHVPARSYLVQGQDLETVNRLVSAYGGKVTSQLHVINGVAADLPVHRVAALLRESAVSSITPNAPVALVANGSGNVAESDFPEVIGADVVWDHGQIGSGVTVAVVDTGIGNHTGLNKDTEGKSGRIVGWIDLVDEKPQPHDPNGHGSHVAGIIANSQIGPDGDWNGVAPGVNLVGVRVLDSTGGGTYERVIGGIQWVIDHQAEYNIQVMNLSLVANVQSPYWADPLNQTVMRAWEAGITVVVAAGNGGPAPMSIGVPGNTPYVITVGAFTDSYTPLDWNDDYLAPFSAAGPTLDAFVKPDLVAPGAHMVSTMLPHAFLVKNEQAKKQTSQYYSVAGTSQATAAVSGVAALTVAQHPGISPDEVKYRLMYTAFPWIDLASSDALYSVWQQGAGRLNAPGAVLDAVIGVANLGMDLSADLAGTAHFQGFSYFDETAEEFRLLGDFSEWAGGYGNWAGGYGNWAGGYGNWAGGYGNWAGGFGNWAGGLGNWAGGYGNWAGGYGNWAGGYGNWAGGYGNWAGGYGNWAGSYGSSEFAAAFVNWTEGTMATAWSATQNWLGGLSDE